VCRQCQSIINKPTRLAKGSGIAAHNPHYSPPLKSTMSSTQRTMAGNEYDDYYSEKLMSSNRHDSTAPVRITKTPTPAHSMFNPPARRQSTDGVMMPMRSNPGIGEGTRTTLSSTSPRGYTNTSVPRVFAADSRSKTVALKGQDSLSSEKFSNRRY
jgi:hypothetical protein